MAAPTTVVTTTGFSGTGTLKVEANLGTGQSSLIDVKGDASGSQTIAFNSAPITGGNANTPMIVATGTNTVSLTGPTVSNFFFTYAPGKIDPKSVGYIASVDTTKGGDLLAGIGGALSTINSAFTQPASSFVNSKQDARENERIFGPSRR